MWGRELPRPPESESSWHCRPVRLQVFTKFRCWTTASLRHLVPISCMCIVRVTHGKTTNLRNDCCCSARLNNPINGLRAPIYSVLTASLLFCCWAISERSVCLRDKMLPTALFLSMLGITVIVSMVSSGFWILIAKFEASIC